MSIVAAVAGCARSDDAAQTAVPGRTLRVCADPNNLPFSNRDGHGFENRLAELAAQELGARVAYTWWPQRRGFVRRTLAAGRCDVVMGVPAAFDPVLTTRAYYRSTYVFVSRKDRNLGVRSFDDPILRRLRIGVHLIGDDGANTPPAHALSSRGVIGNLLGFTIYGDYAQPNPPARIVEAVADGTIDLAIVWGPLAGYFAPRASVPLEVHAVSPESDSPALPFVYDIALGVRRDDTGLKEELEVFLERRADDINVLLHEYGVPRVPSHTRTLAAGTRQR